MLVRLAGPLRRALRQLVPSVLLTVSLLATPAVVFAQPDPSNPAVELYVQGRDLLSAGKPADALPLLERSLSLLPSPNTELLIAHANRDLGKRAKAMDFYERAQASADAGIARGETRYTETSAEARRSKDDLASKVGTVVVSAPARGRFTVYRSAADPVALSGPGQVRVDPGEIRVTFTPDGQSAAQERSVSVVGGQVATVSFEVTEGNTSTPGTPVAPSGSLVGPLTIGGSVLLGVGLVGVGLFAGFGAVALSKYNELDECGSDGCEAYPDAAAAEPVRADGDQAVLNANISIGVGAAFLLAGGIMILVDVVNGPEQGARGDGAPPPVRPALVVGPGTLYAGVSLDLL